MYFLILIIVEILMSQFPIKTKCKITHFLIKDTFRGKNNQQKRKIKCKVLIFNID